MRHLRDPFTPDGNINATTASSGVFIRAIQSGNWAFPLSIDALGGMNRMDAITVFIAMLGEGSLACRWCRVPS
ncbi:hypothetical protein [Caballeronia zhejiangensis]|jgi:hypothetical protein|uniref:hypothetical protein n=1 Tax=Caballeronia zhejiangensis TaxID=871203 RepID=UPI001FD1515D|nr:hypothetical protein [Caballeronia zhejiangensis]